MTGLILAIDAGNSTTNIGLFDLNGSLQFRSDITTGKRSTRDQCAISLAGIFKLYGADINAITGIIISSVVPPITLAMCDAVRFLTGIPPMLMGPGVKTGLNIKSDIHAQMGTDIVAYSVGAISKYPGPVIVVDMGTAVTMSLLRGNAFEGCAIMPGVRVALEALSDRAAELPHISIEPPDSVLGHNTVGAMCSGVVYGYAGMIDGMIDRMEEECAVATVVGTGNAAPDILKYCKHNILFDDDLLLNGLYLIYQKNTNSRQRKV